MTNNQRERERAAAMAAPAAVRTQGTGGASTASAVSASTLLPERAPLCLDGSANDMRLRPLDTSKYSLENTPDMPPEGDRQWRKEFEESMRGTTQKLLHLAIRYSKEHLGGDVPPEGLPFDCPAFTEYGGAAGLRIHPDIDEYSNTYYKDMACAKDERSLQ